MQQGAMQKIRCRALLRSQENCSILAIWMNWSVERWSRPILLLYIFLATLEERSTCKQLFTTPEMRQGEISDEMDIEVFDSMLIQSLLAQKLLISRLIKVNA